MITNRPPDGAPNHNHFEVFQTGIHLIIYKDASNNIDGVAWQPWHYKGSLSRSEGNMRVLTNSREYARCWFTFH